MEQRLTQEVFYGSAIAALCGLLFGLMLHIPWESHPGGPQILFSRAEAAEPARPGADDLAVDAPTDGPTELADEDTGHVPPTPLPVTRLRPALFDVQPAAADEAQREDPNQLEAEDAGDQPEGDG